MAGMRWWMGATSELASVVSMEKQGPWSGESSQRPAIQSHSFLGF